MTMAAAEAAAVGSTSPDAPPPPAELTTREKIEALEKRKSDGESLSSEEADELSALKTLEMKERFDQMMKQNSFNNKIRGR